ncbi:pyruvoyl-dependent arginine decarboxylase [Halobacteriales archaeon SW_6_65_46]|nr:MAG: pyruvoyl-dependent arginine decarboxylase [Halobacteriales archaeon SW_6_65_46]
MKPIRVVWGTGHAATEMAAYDAALADAGIGNYNLVAVSSVIPEGATVTEAGTAPTLGPVGERLTVVEASETVPVGDRDPACAGLAWATTESQKGLFYEASGRDERAVRDAVTEGITAGRALRGWSFTDQTARLAVADRDSKTYTSAVVVAVYGDSEPIL